MHTLYEVQQRPQLGPLPCTGFLPSLLGRAVSGLFASAVDALAASASEAAAAQADVASRATARLHSSARLRERFGDVSVGPIMSTSSSTMSLNGVTSKQIVLVLPVNGSRGQSGQAQVQYSAGSQGERMQIRVRVA